ncbi:hypothetical protein ABVT39_024945, partial [Epinephelus coioides]
MFGSIYRCPRSLRTCAPPSPKIPREEAETSVGDGTYFSFELHRREVLSKRSQVQIFLRCEEEGQGSSERERDRRRSEGGRGRDREAQEKKCWRKRKKERASAGESATERVGMDLCIPLGVKR